MRSLTAQALLRVWEVGVSAPPLDRALTILQTAFPAAARDELAALSIGRRNARLFNVRALTFGARLDGLAQCPACNAELAFSLDTPDLTGASDAPDADEIHETASDGWQLRFRLPNGTDLEAMARCADISAARRLLIARCLAQAVHNGAEVSPQALPEAMIAELARQMVARDPHAEVELDLQCPTCDARWLLEFDIEAFFWSEIVAQAKRLLREVHLLARAYGWREADILALSAARRQIYLEMIGG